MTTTPPGLPLAQRRALIELGTAWLWLSLVFIVWLHAGWTADQIAELLAVFTPYVMLAGPARPGESGGGIGGINS